MKKQKPFKIFNEFLGTNKTAYHEQIQRTTSDNF